MKRIILLLICCVWFYAPMSAQKTVEELSHKLNTNPYNRIWIDYTTKLLLPDSVKQTFLTALSGRLTPHLQDSLMKLEPWQEAAFLEQSQRECKGDSLCVVTTYQKIVAEALKNNVKYYAKEGISRDLVLAAGSWNIREAIPILENALDNERYGQQSVKMALAKMGNNDYRQELIDKYTLSYILAHTPLDTVNYQARYTEDMLGNGWSATEGLKVAMYLENKEIILNVLDLMFIKGDIRQNIGDEFFFVPVSYYILESFFRYFNWSLFYSNSDILYDYSDEFREEIRVLQNKSYNRKKKKAIMDQLSVKYHTKLRNWVIENVNFE